MKEKNKKNLNYEITICYNENGIPLKDIIKENFLLYIRELKEINEL